MRGILWLFDRPLYIDFGHKSGIWQIESKQHIGFNRKLGELAIQIKDEYYINWKNTRIGKLFNNFP